ncbi:magnesium/cobalt transporter CorA [bacterium]|nr:magnesium/cobalt transporter CorA [bacterium]MBU1995473.1 magnesium/cobalt transporter CorA [bacterium]
MTEKIGLSPGTAVYTGYIEEKEPDITIVRYDAANIEVGDYRSLDEVQRICSGLDDTTKSWIHIEPISDSGTIARLSDFFGLHSLVVEDILSVNHRPKIEEYDEYSFIIIKYAQYEEGELIFYQIALVLKEKQIISFADKSPNKFDMVNKRLEKADSRIRKGDSEYLFLALIDYVIDHYFLVLESISEEIEELEEEILYNPTKESIEHVHHLKRNLMNLKKSIWPMREVINTLLQSDRIKQEYHIYYRDVYDHVIDIIDIIEGYRDTISGFLDIYLSTLSNRMNEIMKTLSIIATIFIPLSFLTGYFGMNFKYETILESQSAYMWSNILMISIPVALLIYFKLRKWF